MMFCFLVDKYSIYLFNEHCRNTLSRHFNFLSCLSDNSNIYWTFTAQLCVPHID